MLKNGWLPSLSSARSLSLSSCMAVFCVLITATNISRSVRDAFSAFRYLINFSICKHVTDHVHLQSNLLYMNASISMNIFWQN